MTDEDFDNLQIDTVKKLLHRVGNRHSCKCWECRAIVRVCALAREAVSIKAARRRERRKKP